MNNEFFIVGDIAGQYDTLLKLIEQFPKTATIVSVGDMIDRGPKSKEVVEFFASGKGIAILGNHCHMMLDAVALTKGEIKRGYYSLGLWEMNGGTATIDSYLGFKSSQDILRGRTEFVSCLPDKHLDYLKSLPTYRAYDTNFGGLIITHAPINPSVNFGSLSDFGDHALTTKAERSLIWNRGRPRRKKGYFQVYGHNSYRNAHWHQDDLGKWGVCIDTSHGKKLTAIHWPSMEIYEQEYV